MEDVRVTRLINGPEAFTPDGEFCLGETEVRGLFVAAGFCAHGLAGAGGVGKVMAEWIAGGEPSLDLWQMDVRRFGAHYRSPRYTLARTREVYETYYDIKYPNHERAAGPAAAALARVRLARGARRRVRREVRLGAGQLVRGQRGRRATRRCARAAGRGATGRRRSAPSTAPAARPPRCSTSPRSPSSRSRARARRSFLERLCETASRARSGRSPTRRCSTGAAGSSATSPSRGSPRTASGSSPGPRSAATTSPGSPRTSPRTTTCGSRT